jgi:hypothetical protein
VLFFFYINRFLESMEFLVDKKCLSSFNHTFSMKLISRDWAGHAVVFISFSSLSLRSNCNLRTSTVSYWDKQFPCGKSLNIKDLKLFCEISIYFLELVISLTLLLTRCWFTTLWRDYFLEILLLISVLVIPHNLASST